MKTKNKIKDLQEMLAKLRTEKAKQDLISMIRGWKNKRIKVEMRKSESIVNALPIGLCIVSKDYKIQSQNEWLTNRFGKKEGKICYNEYMKSNKPCLKCFIRKAIDCDRVERGELVTADNRHYEIIAVPIGQLNGKASGVEVIIDVTEKKRMEKAIFQTQQKYADLIDSINVGIYQTTTDQKGSFAEINPALISMFEANSKDELLKHNVADLYANRNKRKEIINKALKSGFIKDEEVEFKTLRGNKFWGSITLAKTKDHDGNIYFDGIVDDITERRQREDQLRKLSLIDELTGLHNRRGFLALADHQFKITKRHKTEIALFYIDLDNLKRINDTTGHPDGDRALIDIAGILKDTCRESDVVARMGGDEFAILAVDITKENSNAFLNRVKKNINDHNTKATRPYGLSISIGAAYHDFKKPSSSIHKLLSQADKSMYEQKRDKMTHKEVS